MINKFVFLKTKETYLTFMAIFFLLILTACVPAPSEPTPIPPSQTPMPPTETQIPPTATVEPSPTATLLPTEVVIPRPSPRIYISFAFDIESNKIILYGGQTHDTWGEDGETWAYDVAANKWTLMNPSLSPPKLLASSLAYDSESDRVIMFGGASGRNIFSDTWAYDYNTNTWTKMSDGPRQHLGGRIDYDTESDRIILFGGLNITTLDYYNDTWAYDYNTDTWTDMQPVVSPPGRNYQSITYDTKADRILTWGGFDMDDKPVGDSLWSYDFNSNTWQELSPGEAPHPLCRDYSAMAYDVESDRSILFGGIQLGKDFGTWAYDYNSNTWLEMKPLGQPVRVSKHHLTYISSVDQVFLFGGDFCDKFCNLSNEIWSYDFNSNTWENITPLP